MGWCQISRKKCYVTLEWPLTCTSVFKVRDLERELGEAHGELTTQEERLTGLRELLQQRTQRLEDINDQHILVQVCGFLFFIIC